MPHFFDKEKYVNHYENLQLYLRLGMKLRKIHHIVEFNQSQWLKPYICWIQHTGKNRSRKNGDKNGKVKKLMNNAVYGKTMENITNRIVVKLVIKNKAISHTKYLGMI